MAWSTVKHTDNHTEPLNIRGLQVTEYTNS